MKSLLCLFVMIIALASPTLANDPNAMPTPRPCMRDGVIYPSYMCQNSGTTQGVIYPSKTEPAPTNAVATEYDLTAEVTWLFVRILELF